MNDNSIDASQEATAPTLTELKRAARKVRSRHPLAKGGRGSRKRSARKVIIDSPASKNSPQKGLTEPRAATDSRELHVADAISGVPPAPAVDQLPVMSDEDRWRNAGDINVLVYARPVHPRMLLIQLDDGSHGRCMMHPSDRVRFSVNKRIWVRHDRKDIYQLAGRYNRWGARV